MPRFEWESPLIGEDVEHLLTQMVEKLKKIPELSKVQGMEVDWIIQESRVAIKSAFFEGSLMAQAGKFRVHGELSWMALPFKGLLTSKLDELVEHVLKSRGQT